MVNIILVGLAISYLYFLLRIKEVICKDCGAIDNLRKQASGNLLIEIVLWCCLIIPGLIYSIWSASSRRYTCKSCAGHNLIPTNSPAGKMLVSKFAPQAADQPTHEDAINKNKILKIIGIALFLVFCVWNFTNKKTELREIATSEKHEVVEPVQNISEAPKSKSQIAKQTKKASKIKDLNSILEQSKELYMELCSSLSSDDCFSVAQKAISSDEKGKLALQLCLKGEMKTHNPCNWMSYFYDWSVVNEVTRIACEDQQNSQACLEYANNMTFFSEKNPENRKKGIDMLSKICKMGSRKACESLSLTKSIK